MQNTHFLQRNFFFIWQREHFKLDWHRFNLKQKILDKPIMSEEAFEETISGMLLLLYIYFPIGSVPFPLWNLIF